MIVYGPAKKPVTIPLGSAPATPKFGVQRKPEGCARCAYATTGVGFCPDDRPETPRIAMLLEAPGQDEILESRPLVGRAGKAWLRRLVEYNGYRREDVLICNTLRCNPASRDGENNSYPTGDMRIAAETACRQYDTFLREFNPDVFLVTVHPAMLLRASAMTRLVQRDVKLAFEFADKGYRPLVLMGDKAMKLVAPWLDGGVKRWRGHWWLGKYRTRFE